MVGGVKAHYAVLLALVLGVGYGKGGPVPEQRAMENISELNAEAEAYFDWGYNYYSGDPAGQNQYLLPESNIIGGYGLFSSTNAKAFLVNIERE